MHKHTMIPNPDGQYDLTDPMSVHMQLPPSVVPQININLDSASGVETLIGCINEAVYPGVYGPKTAPQELHDKWGTPFEWSQMPDTIDVRDRNIMMMNRTPSPMSMLCMRMKWAPYSGLTAGIGADFNMPFDHLSIHLGAEKAIVFIVTKGDPVTIEDDIGIFPSDALITQLKMLEQRQTPRT